MSSVPWPDLLVVAAVVLSGWAAVRRGFIAVLLSLAGLVLGVALAFILYPVIGAWLVSATGWSPVWAEPLAFLGVWLLLEALFGIAEGLLISRVLYRLNYSPASRALAVAPGVLQGLIAAAVLLTSIALVPISGTWRNDVLQSFAGSRLVGATLTVERPLESIFGPAAHQALGFLTIAPATPASEAGGETEQPVKLNFAVSNATVDVDAEEAMLLLVNQERTSRGLSALTMDPQLRLLARAHAEDMFQRGYFSHYTPEGVDPFQRMQQANIAFGAAGENLALAPILDIAHQGLMNSPGHRANILSTSFHKVGIGVLDGGIYGKMFVQEFTD